MLKSLVIALLLLPGLACSSGPQQRVLPLPQDAQALEAFEEGRVALAGDRIQVLRPPSAAGLELPGTLPPELGPPGLARARDLFFKGNLQEARVLLARVRAALEANPSLLPRDEEAREALYGALLLLYRIEWMEGRPDEGLADWLALHLPDQEPSVAQVPPELEARLAAAKTAQAAPRPLRVRLDREGSECVVYADGLLLGGGSNMVASLSPGAHWVQVDCAGASLPLLRRVSAEGELRVRPQLERQLSRCGGTLCLAPHPDPEVTQANAAIAAAAAGAEGAVGFDATGGGTYYPVSGTWSRRLNLKNGKLVVDPVPPGRRTRHWLALGGLLGSAAALGVGVLYNLEYNDLMARTNRGWEDHRAEGDRALALSALGYGVSALLLGGAGLAWFWPESEGSPADGTWWPVGR
jgi:hypothetical protein